MSESSRLDRIAIDYFEATYQANPVLATSLGVHSYDDRLGDHSRAAIEAHTAATRGFLAQLRDVDATRLIGPEAVDFQLLESDMLNTILTAEGIADWRRNPTYYVDTALYSILPLVTRDFAPRAERIRSLTARLGAMAGLLDSGRENLDNPPKIHTETAIETAEAALAFLTETVPTFARVEDVEAGELVTAAARAARSLVDYTDFLRTDLLPRSFGEFAVGRDVFESKLRVEHMLDVTADEAGAIGRQVFGETRQALIRLAGELGEDEENELSDSDVEPTWADLVTEHGQRHPTPAGLLEAYRAELVRLRAFVVERDLVTIPANEELSLVETPAFARSTTPFAAYLQPAPFETSQRGEFWVTPIDETASEADQEAQLAEHSYYGIPSTALHEAYPGHHLQLVQSNNVSTFIRRHMLSSLFCEGWALYCEQLLGEQGYVPLGAATDDPRVFRLFLLKDQLWRAARIMIDVGLHTGGMTPDQAVRILVDDVKLAPALARVEVSRYAATPTQPLSYTFGKLEILRLRTELADLPLREFHDKLLSHGTIPLRAVLHELVGG